MTAEDQTSLGKAIAPLSEGFVRACSKLFGKASDEIGEFLGQWFQVKMRPWREENLTKTFNKAESMLTSALEPESISKKSLITIFEGASQEDDDFLQSYWAGLLASTLQGYLIHPAFPGFVKDLSPTEARILNSLFEQGQSHHPAPLHTLLGLAKDELSLLVAVQNLCRLNLCVLEPIQTVEKALKSHSFLPSTIQLSPPNVPKFDPPASPFPKKTSQFPELQEQQIRINQLGIAFVEACNP